MEHIHHETLPLVLPEPWGDSFNIDVACKKYCDDIMSPDYRPILVPSMDDWTNFSLIQYCCSKTVRHHIKHSVSLSNYLFEQGKSYLDVGMGAGFTPMTATEFDIDGVEWDHQNPIFALLRKHFDTDKYLKYICNDVTSDDFNIIGCEKRYDYAILHRFYPLAHAKSEEETMSILKKFQKYADCVILSDSMDNHQRWGYKLDLYEKLATKLITERVWSTYWIPIKDL